MNCLPQDNSWTKCAQDRIQWEPTSIQWPCQALALHDDGRRSWGEPSTLDTYCCSSCTRAARRSRGLHALRWAQTCPRRQRRASHPGRDANTQVSWYGTGGVQRGGKLRIQEHRAGPAGICYNFSHGGGKAQSIQDNTEPQNCFKTVIPKSKHSTLLSCGNLSETTYFFISSSIK